LRSALRKRRHTKRFYLRANSESGACVAMYRQALALASPLTSSTGIFSNSRDTTITGGTFTEIQGNQYIFHGHVTADILDQTSAKQASEGRIDDLDFSDVRLSMLIVVGIVISVKHATVHGP